MGGVIRGTESKGGIKGELDFCMKHQILEKSVWVWNQDGSERNIGISIGLHEMEQRVCWKCIRVMSM